MPSRRAALRAGGLAVTTALAGCSRLPFVSSPALTLRVQNFTDQSRRVAVDLLRADGHERSEALVYARSFDLAPHDAGDDHEMREEDAVESRRYVVRATVDAGPPWEYTFYPDCTGDDQPRDELYVQATPREGTPVPYVDYQQNVCSTDAAQY
ncbi:hypothetical protein [Halorarius halobius]|uniref:hypothetical protein n=1 Tax=Halorarius halobius TaxID=2962671 RepID=UPI0020CE8219|nr:hypothetical protein [Halorarius halobius]